MSAGGTPGSPAKNPFPGVSMSLDQQAISVAATTTQPAPNVTISANVSGLTQTQVVYLFINSTHNGIATVTPSAYHFLPALLDIQFDAPSALAVGAHSDTLQVGFCFDQACTQPLGNSPQTIKVNYTTTQSTFTLTGLSPAAAMEGSGGFTLTLTGTSFTANSRVAWNGSTEPTTFVSATQLTAQIPASAITAAGKAPVTVTDPVSGTTSAQAFTVDRAPLALSSLSPLGVTVNGLPFTLTVLGNGFSTSSVVNWNGTALSTRYDSDQVLLAQVPAADINAIGTAAVTVADPTSTVTTAGPQSLAITAASKDAVADHINVAHNGAIDFANMSLPSSPTWSTTVTTGSTSVLIVQGKVIVSGTSVGGSGSGVVALDQATGNVVWSTPSGIGISGSAYDNGQVFTVAANSTVKLEAFDVNTGALQWSTPLTGQSDFETAPTAANGIVYVVGEGLGSTLYALDEATGRLLWSQAGNGEGPAAVTADGVYLSSACLAEDYRPATGELIWQFQGPCGGGAGGGIEAANGLVYAPDGLPGNPNDSYDAETGTHTGSYPAESDAAFSATFGYYLGGPMSNALIGVTLADNVTQWRFTGDSQLARYPIVVGQYVFVASQSGKVYGLDAATGSQLWQVTGPTAGFTPVLAAGDGLLVMTSGNQVVTYTLSTNP